jgi:hypothetical protein
MQKRDLGVTCEIFPFRSPFIRYHYSHLKSLSGHEKVIISERQQTTARKLPRGTAG